MFKTYLLVMLLTRFDGAVEAEIIDEGLSLTDCLTISTRIVVFPGYTLVCEEE
jgi:hypothetical protein